LGRQDWLAGLKVLAKSGMEAVQWNPSKVDEDVTKGSFYCQNREDLLEAMLQGGQPQRQIMLSIKSKLKGDARRSYGLLQVLRSG